MTQPNAMTPPDQEYASDEQAEQDLTALVAGLSDEQIRDLADLAEAMHAEADDGDE